MEQLEAFLEAVLPKVHPPAERARAEALLLRWATAWQGPDRGLEATRSIHGTFLHFNQKLGGIWSQAFGFRLTPRHGLALRGPDPDRARKAHKFRAHKLERALWIPSSRPGRPIRKPTRQGMRWSSCSRKLRMTPGKPACRRPWPA